MLLKHSLAGALLVAGVVACGPSGPQPPATATRPVVDELHGERFTDPYRWLEEQDHDDVRAWIEAQNRYTDQIFARTPAAPEILDRLRALAGTPDIGRPQRGGDFEYFSLRRAGEPLAAIYRRPRPDAPADIDPAATFERIVDPGPLSADGTVSVDLIAVAPDGSRLIYGVRDGGQDERSLRVLDLKTMAEVERFPNALWDSVSLEKDGSGFYYVRRSRRDGARVRFHAWGARLEDDPVLFGEGYGPTAFISMAQNDDGSRFSTRCGMAGRDPRCGCRIAAPARRHARSCGPSTPTSLPGSSTAPSGCRPITTRRWGGSSLSIRRRRSRSGGAPLSPSATTIWRTSPASTAECSRPTFATPRAASSSSTRRARSGARWSCRRGSRRRSG